MTIKINISQEYTTIPGARYRDDGPFSGQQFREDFLEQYFKDKSSREKIVVNLDGLEGYATSFLEESFGGLARKFGVKICLERLDFICEEDPLLKSEIRQYIENCDES